MTITLGVSDLNRSVIFHRDGLGLPTTFEEGEGIAFFQLRGGHSGCFTDPDGQVAWNPYFPQE